MSAPHRRLLHHRILYRLLASGTAMRVRLRLAWCRVQGARIGKNVRLGRVDITVPEHIQIGDDCEIEDTVRLRPGGQWQSSSISIGARTFIGYGTQINVGAPFVIGSDCMVAPNTIFTDAHHPIDDPSKPMRAAPCEYHPIRVGNDVWIGAHSTILKGVTIGDGAVVAAGSVVVHSVPSHEIWGGVPAKKLKSRREDSDDPEHSSRAI